MSFIFQENCWFDFLSETFVVLVFSSILLFDVGIKYQKNEILSKKVEYLLLKL
jgi:hypothetical protein